MAEKMVANRPSRNQRMLQILQQITGLTAAMLDHQMVMDTIVRSLPELLDIDACTIRLMDSSTRSFVLGAAHGVSLDYLSRETIDTDANLAMVRSGHPVHSTHVDEDPFLPFRDAANREGIKDVLTLPIVYQSELIGIMRLLAKTVQGYGPDEISCCMALAEHVGIAISHGRMFKEMEHQLTFLREIQALSRLVNSTLDLNEVLRTMVERVAVTMATKGCTLRLIHPVSKKLELAASFGVSAGYLDRGAVESEGNVLMVLNGDPVSIYDASHDHRVEYHQQMQDEGIVSLLAVPIKVNSEVIGVMRILSDVPRVFNDTEVRFAVTLAEVGGTAIRNARNYQKINLLLKRIEGHEQFLADIINSLQHQLLVLNRDRQVVLANKVFLDAMDRDEADVLGMGYGDFCSGLAQGQSCPVDQVLQDGSMQPFVQELENGEHSRWFERTASPIRDAEGNIEYVIEVIRDITAERMLAREREQSSKLQGVVELAGTVAHEINSPLFAALGTAQLLMEDSAPPEVMDDLEVIVRNLKQISELTAKMTAMTGFTGKEYVGGSRILTLADEEKKETSLSAANKGGVQTGERKKVDQDR